MGESRRAARMIDVGDKQVTDRVAVATARVRMEPGVRQMLRDGTLRKGNALEVARVAAILAAKQTPQILPLCHPIRLSEVRVDYEYEGDRTLLIRVTVRAQDRTGVEMEALTAAAVAGLSVIDACKPHQPDIVITDVRLEEKRGGKTGAWVRNPDPS